MEKTGQRALVQRCEMFFSFGAGELLYILYDRYLKNPGNPKNSGHFWVVNSELVVYTTVTLQGSQNFPLRWAKAMVGSTVGKS